MVWGRDGYVHRDQNRLVDKGEISVEIILILTYLPVPGSR